MNWNEQKTHYMEILGTIESDPRIRELKKYPQHGSSHPFTVLENARKCFDINKKVENIILSHMWPLPFAACPGSREAVLVNLSDKYCAYQEMKNKVVHIESVIKKREVKAGRIFR